MTTFIFTVYLTSAYFGSKEGTSAALSLGLTIAGFFIALLAPVTGQRADKTGKGIFWLGVNTLSLVTLTALCFFVAPSPAYLWLGVTLVSAASVFSEFAFVNYNAVLPRVSTPNNIGKISGLGWSAGYLGGVLALGVVLWGFVLEPNGLRLSTDDAFNIRAVALFSAFWCLVFCLPLLVRMRRRERFLPEVLPVRELKFLERGFTRLSPARQGGLFASYRELWRTIVRLQKSAPQTLYFLLASAVFRDGLTGIFTFGGILAAGTFGFTTSDVIISVLPVTPWPLLVRSLAGTWTTTWGRRKLLCSRWWVFCWPPPRCCCSRTRARSGCAHWCCACLWARRSRRPARSWRVLPPRARRVNCSACTPQPGGPQAS